MIGTIKKYLPKSQSCIVRIEDGRDLYLRLNHIRNPNEVAVGRSIDVGKVVIPLHEGREACVIVPSTSSTS